MIFIFISFSFQLELHRSKKVIDIIICDRQSMSTYLGICLRFQLGGIPGLVHVNMIYILVADTSDRPVHCTCIVYKLVSVLFP